jgi:predicted phage terminase large subunit-like protein
MCQYQQDPLPAAGVLIQADSIQYYSVLPQFDLLYCAWDMGLMGGEDNDYTVGAVVGRAAGRFYLVDVIREQADTVRQLQMVREIDNKYPHLARHIVESGAGGDPIMSMLQREIGNFERLLPRQYGGSKENRVKATLPLYAESRVLLPDLAVFVGDCLHELIGFPNAKQDDFTDAFTYALLWGVQYDGTGEIYLGLDAPGLHWHSTQTLADKQAQELVWTGDTPTNMSRRNARSIFV